MYSKIQFNWLHLKSYPNLTDYQLSTAVKMSQNNFDYIKLVRAFISSCIPKFNLVGWYIKLYPNFTAYQLSTAVKLVQNNFDYRKLLWAYISSCIPKFSLNSCI